MYTKLMLPALVALSLAACKPTPRTAIQGQNRAPQQEEKATDEKAAPTVETPAPVATPEPAPEQPAPAVEPAPAAEPTPAAEEAPVPAADETPAPTASSSLLTVSATQQDYSILRPWQKEGAGRASLMGIYLGEGRVLIDGEAVEAATYVELGLPDGSRAVAAKVLRYDRDLGLALITVANEKDLDIFDTRLALSTGEPMKLGDKAGFHGLVRGLIPVSVPLQAESGEVDGSSLPRLNMRAAQPLPQGGSQGFPIVQDGKLVGMSSGYNSQTQSVSCINADLINRFLAGKDGVSASCPVIGLGYTGLDDPVFRDYLKLADNQGGLYVTEVAPGSGAEAAGVKKGDVITAVEGLAIDMRGRCEHPLYGVIDSRCVIRSLKPLGEKLTLTISRDGQKQDIAVPLDRAAVEKALFVEDIPGVQPRYIVWGGLIFQPLSDNYLSSLRGRAGGGLPVQFLAIERREKELREKGVTELVALSQVIPTPATLSYDSVGFCLVESVNGKPVHNFAEFAALLDEPTENGLVSLGINKPPYTIYMDRQVAEASNASIRRNAIQQLRNLGEQASEDPAPAPAAPEAPAPVQG